MPRFFVWRHSDDGTVRAAAAGFYGPPPERLAGRVIARVAFNSPPACETSSDGIVAPLIDWLRQSRSIVGAGLGALDGRRRWCSHPLPNRIQALECVVRPSASGVVPARGTRGWVRKARRLGIEVTSVTNIATIGEFAVMAKALHERLRSTKHVAVRPVEPARATAAWHGLIAGGHGRLYMAHREGGALAGSLFGCFDRRAYYLQAAASDEARGTGAAHLVLKTALDDLFAAGIAEVNLGPTGPDAQTPGDVDHGLLRFKAAFGAEIAHIEGGAITTRPVRSKLIQYAARALRR